MSNPRTFAFQAGFSDPGLITVGVTLLDAQKAVILPRTTAGIINLGGGNYGAVLTLPDSFSTGFVQFDDGRGGQPVSGPVNAAALVAAAAASLPPPSLLTQAQATAAAKLGLALADLPASFSDELTLAEILLVWQSPGFANLAALSGPDIFLTGYALGCFVAARLVSPLRIAMGAGVITGLTDADGAKIVWSGPVYADPPALIKEGQEAIARISFIVTERATKNGSVKLFGNVRQNTHHYGRSGHNQCGYGSGYGFDYGAVLLDYALYPLLGNWG